MTGKAEVEQARALIESKVGSSFKPTLGIVLGSGLSKVGEELIEHHGGVAIPYGEIPSFPTSTVAGHKGRLVCATKDGVDVIIMQGRVHFYEGYQPAEVAFPIRVMGALGIKTLMVTNSSGGMGEGFKAGDLMLIEDHLNLTGNNPLVGPNEPSFGPRFPDMTETYPKNLRELAISRARALNINLQSGVYAGVLGPTYETPAEIKMLKTLGASAVGMSTVYESIAASHMGLPVLGIACITNLAAGISPRKLTHEEVTENAAKASEQFCQLVMSLIDSLATVN